MGKMIYRSEKVNTPGEVSGREEEANRTQEDIGRFEGSDIDWEMTKDNYDFKITHNWVDAVKTKCEELGCPVKKDSVLVLDHLITASPEWMEQQSEETKMAFFKDSLDWIIDEFCGGDESLLLNARIHKDESNWHLCAATIPIVKNKERSEEELSKLKRKPRQREYSLNAKEIMGGRGKYSTRQQSIEDKIGKKYGLEEREIREPKEAKKHKTVQQAKLAAVKEEVRTEEQNLDATKKELQQAKEALQEVNNDLSDKTKQIEEKNKRIGLCDRVIEERKVKLQEQNKELTDKNAQLEDKTKQLEKLDIKLLERAEMLDRQVEKSAKKNKRKFKGSDVIGVSLPDYQDATSNVSTTKGYINSDVHTPKEKAAYEREARNLSQKAREYDKMIEDQEQIIQDRVAKEMHSQDRATLSARAHNAEHKLQEAYKQIQEFQDATMKMLQIMNLSPKQFEKQFNVEFWRFNNSGSTDDQKYTPTTRHDEQEQTPGTR